MPGTLALLAALQAGVAPATVRVASDSSCPTADAVREALEALGGRNAPRAGSATVRSHGDRLAVELVWPGDLPSGTRELTVPPDCESRAQSAAVVIASWLGTLPEATLVSAPLGVPPAELRLAEPAPPAPERIPAAASPPVTLATESSARPVEARPPVASGAMSSARPRRARGYWLGGGVVGSAGGGVVPGIRIELLRMRPGAGFKLGWMASALAAMPRSRSLDGGTSSWVRPAIGLSGVASWGGPRLRWATDLGPLVGLTIAWGSGYSANETDASPTWGGTGGLRLQLPLASSMLWGELRIIHWLQPQSLRHEIRPTGIVSTVDMPSWEALLTLGWSFAL